jgi:hypothetical protein
MRMEWLSAENLKRQKCFTYAGSSSIFVAMFSLTLMVVLKAHNRHCLSFGGKGTPTRGWQACMDLGFAMLAMLVGQSTGFSLYLVLL